MDDREREAIRVARDWALADQLRLGMVVEYLSEQLEPVPEEGQKSEP